MVAYNPESWHELFIMTGGAAAALAGLVFVAVSLNDDRILDRPALAGLAARALTTLVALVVLCVVGLVPGQSEKAFAVETLGVAVLLAVFLLVIAIRNVHDHQQVSWKLTLFGFTAAATLPALVGGVSLLVGHGGGLYWLAVEFALGICIAVHNGWVLLIQIRREERPAAE